MIETEAEFYNTCTCTDVILLNNANHRYMSDLRFQNLWDHWLVEILNHIYIVIEGSLIILYEYLILRFRHFVSNNNKINLLAQTFVIISYKLYRTNF